jgi:hypothetical protein
MPPKDLTLLKYPHKSEKIETITRDHQTSYETFVCRINEEYAFYLSKYCSSLVKIISIQSFFNSSPG